MAETEETVKESCSILMISKDMEWMLAFSKGVQRFYLLNERRAKTLEAAESRMLESRPDLVILAVQDGLPSMDKLRPCIFIYRNMMRRQRTDIINDHFINGFAQPAQVSG